jgi:hypothetical protein
MTGWGARLPRIRDASGIERRDAPPAHGALRHSGPGARFGRLTRIGGTRSVDGRRTSAFGLTIAGSLNPYVGTPACLREPSAPFPTPVLPVMSSSHPSLAIRKHSNARVSPLLGGAAWRSRLCRCAAVVGPWSTPRLVARLSGPRTHAGAAAQQGERRPDPPTSAHASGRQVPPAGAAPRGAPGSVPGDDHPPATMLRARGAPTTPAHGRVRKPLPRLAGRLSRLTRQAGRSTFGGATRRRGRPQTPDDIRSLVMASLSLHERPAGTRALSFQDLPFLVYIMQRDASTWRPKRLC